MKGNKKKQILAVVAILMGIVLCLSACSKKATLFTTMKEAQEVKVSDLSMQMNLTIPEVGDVGITMTGQTDAKQAKLGMSLSMAGATYSIDDFVRMNSEGMYLNYRSLINSMGLGAYMGDSANIPTWLKMQPVEITEDAQKTSDALMASLLDAFEKSCSGMQITEDNGTFTLNVNKDNFETFANALLDQTDANISTWYDSYVQLLEQMKMDEFQKQYTDIAGLDSSEANTLSAQDLKDNKDKNIETIKTAITNAKTELTKMKEQADAGNGNLDCSYSISVNGKKGSREVKQGLKANLTTDDDQNIAMDLQMTQNEISSGTITVDSPDPAQCQDYAEYMQSLQSSLSK